MIKFGSLLEPRYVMIQIFEPVVEHRIVAAYHSKVALEVLDIDYNTMSDWTEAYRPPVSTYQYQSAR